MSTNTWLGWITNVCAIPATNTWTEALQIIRIEQINRNRHFNGPNKQRRCNVGAKTRKQNFSYFFEIESTLQRATGKTIQSMASSHRDLIDYPSSVLLCWLLGASPKDPTVGSRGDGKRVQYCCTLCIDSSLIIYFK